MNRKTVRKSDSDGNKSMTYVGMDLHKNFLQIATMDDDGNILQNTRLNNDLQLIDAFFHDIGSDNIKVVMESSNVWYNIYNYLRYEKKLDVVLSNPLKTKAIASAKVKTDKVDAMILADLLRGGYIAECYVPDKKTMELRDLVKHREFLVRMRSKIKNRIHAILLLNGTRIDAKQPFSKIYIKRLKELNNYRINGYLSIIESLESEISKATTMVQNFAKQDRLASLLVSIPGIGFYSALLISSYISDINRFPDSNHLCAYAGLAPSTRSSGGITHHGRITKTGSKYLRWVLAECVHSHIRYQRNSNITRFYHRIAKRKGNAKATVAAASKLLKVIYWVLKEQREYQSITVKE